jgi:stage II sporulation protein D
MSQWGAYGYARHGWSYKRILRHYYPGTRLTRVSSRTVRVLLGAGRARYTVGCAAPFLVTEGDGARHRLRAGRWAFGPRMRLPVAHKRVRAKRAHGHGKKHRFRVVAVRRVLTPPLTFDCPTAPLEINGSRYHGLLAIYRWGGKLASVNHVSLEDYLRGVVGGEMPSHWNMAALEAQAVAARSYALATVKPRGAYDLYDDTRSQVYGGLDYEGPRTDLALARTRGRVLTWRGAVAATFFFSTSGGRTASIRDVWPEAASLPYLRSVADPYDRRSPHHRWGPVAVTPRELAARLHRPALRGARAVHVARTGSGRAATVWLRGSGGTRRVAASKLQVRLGLQSTWFSVGTLSLRPARPRVVVGNELVLRGNNIGLGRAALQVRGRAGRWRTVQSVAPGAFALRVRPLRSVDYRLASRGVAVDPVRVAVAPRLRAEADRERLDGVVTPRVGAAVSVSRKTRSGWKLIGRPRVDARGRFAMTLAVPAKEYRVTAAAGGSFAAATARVYPRERLIAELGP